MTIILYPLLTAALYYLGARAQITRPLWSRYPGWLDRFMLCSACSGFWYGAGVGALGGLHLQLPFLGLDGSQWWCWVVIGLCSIIWTPLIADFHIRALYNVSGTPSTEGTPNAEEEK